MIIIIYSNNHIIIITLENDDDDDEDDDDYDYEDVDNDNDEDEEDVCFHAEAEINYLTILINIVCELQVVRRGSCGTRARSQ